MQGNAKLYAEQRNENLKIFISALLYASLLFAGNAAGAADSLDVLFARVSAAYGPVAPTTISETGTTVSFRQGNGTLHRMYKTLDRFRIDIRYAARTESRAMAGSEAWAQGETANPVLRSAIALQAARIALPWNMLAQRGAVVDRGPVTGAEGKTMHALEITLDQQLKMIVEIDPQSGHILRSRGIQSVGGSAMEFATVYSDFRKRDGRAHAAREDHFAMGQHTGYSLIDKVEYSAPLPDSAFRP